MAAVTSKAFADRIRAADFFGSAATVVGYGNMGRQYVRALKQLGVSRIRVCSKLNEPDELHSIAGVRTVTGGYQRLTEEALPGELAIIATPEKDLRGAASHMVSLGYRRMLIEKPVSLYAREIEQLASEMDARDVYAAVAYNRVAYPSFHEVSSLAHDEGGITSCVYTFTEFIHRINPKHYSIEIMRRWGVANSLHVMSMAHGLVGMPRSWNCYRSGAISWHPNGAVFVGSGISDFGIPFAYHADWGSLGRWSIEVHTRSASYRLCPLEKAFRKSSMSGEWEELTLDTVDPGIKTGFIEQVATILSSPSERIIHLLDLKDAIRLTQFAEEIFGYE